MTKFPIHKTKSEDLTQKFDLNDPIERRKYFQAKAGKEIEELKEYLEHNTFVGFLLAKKAAGKGTMAKMFQDIIGENRVEHISVGDIVREVHNQMENEKKKEDWLNKLEEIYRGPISLEKAIDAFLSRNTKTLVPTEFILALLRIQMEDMEQKGVFIDGFPRNQDQISYSLFFREIMNLRPDPDFFVLLRTPEEIIDTRIKSRVVCPICQSPRNKKVFPTKFVEYNDQKDSFELKCDNPSCDGYNQETLVGKEGDELGIEAIRDRLETDGALIQKASNLQGIPKIYIRNDIPVEKAEEYIDDYEITPSYSYKLDDDSGEVKTIEEQWIIKNDEGIDSYSLLPPATALTLIKEMHKLLVT